MKKLMKLMCVFALVFVAGCGASSSTDEQKEVIECSKHFKQNEILKINACAGIRDFRLMFPPV